jgi:hypothetical protein
MVSISRILCNNDSGSGKLSSDFSPTFSVGYFLIDYDYPLSHPILDRVVVCGIKIIFNKFDSPRKEQKMLGYIRPKWNDIPLSRC